MYRKSVRYAVIASSFEPSISGYGKCLWWTCLAVPLSRGSALDGRSLSQIELETFLGPDRFADGCTSHVLATMPALSVWCEQQRRS